jgi:hypothetical protein
MYTAMDNRCRGGVVAALMFALQLLAIGHGPATLSAQSVDSAAESKGVFRHIGEGFAASVRWYDLPVVYARLFGNSLQPGSEAMRLNLAASSFDRQVQAEIGQTGRSSFGSLKDELLPNALTLSRLGFCIVLDLATEDVIDESDYTHLFVMYKAVMYTQMLTTVVKGWVRRDRPDESNSRSFFSGHTSTAFTWTSFVHRELDDLLDRWEPTSRDATLHTALSVGSGVVLYGWASYVGASRMMDNKHYISDVVAGALVGTLIGNLIYDAHFSDSETAPDFGLATINGTPCLTFSLPLR